MHALHATSLNFIIISAVVITYKYNYTHSFSPQKWSLLVIRFVRLLPYTPQHCPPVLNVGVTASKNPFAHVWSPPVQHSEVVGKENCPGSQDKFVVEVFFARPFCKRVHSGVKVKHSRLWIQFLQCNHRLFVKRAKFRGVEINSNKAPCFRVKNNCRVGRRVTHEVVNEVMRKGHGAEDAVMIRVLLFYLLD